MSLCLSLINPEQKPKLYGHLQGSPCLTPVITLPHLLPLFLWFILLLSHWPCVVPWIWWGPPLQVWGGAFLRECGEREWERNIKRNQHIPLLSILSVLPLLGHWGKINMTWDLYYLLSTQTFCQKQWGSVMFPVLFFFSTNISSLFFWRHPWGFLWRTIHSPFPSPYGLSWVDPISGSGSSHLAYLVTQVLVFCSGVSMTTIKPVVSHAHRGCFLKDCRKEGCRGERATNRKVCVIQELWGVSLGAWEWSQHK